MNFKQILDFSALCLKWWNQYSSPMKVKLLHQNVLHLYKAEHIEAMTKDLNNITKSVSYDLLVPWLGTGLLIRYSNFRSVFV